MRQVDFGRISLRIFSIATMCFLFVPIFVTIIVSFNPAEFILPPTGFTLEWYKRAWTSTKFLDSLFVSLIVGIVATVVANIIGLMTALALVRYRFPGKSAITLFIMSPILIPATIFSLSLYVFVAWFGFGGSKTSLMIAHTVHVLPFAVRILMASLQTFDRSLEEAAYNVGAGRLRTLFSVTLPVVRTGLAASLSICFILSWNDFPISVFLAPPGWLPLPVELYSYIKFQYDAVGAALASSLIILAGVLIVVIDRVAGLRQIVRA
jgi:putative spermidine/putrescine transport system permease protein